MGQRKSSRAHRDLLAVDVFAGCGGLSLGLRQADFRVLGAIEIDELAAKAYKENHPNTRLWQNDVRQIPAIQVRKELGLRRGRLDLLAGCPPCQGFSTLKSLNRSKRILDPGQKDLLFEMLRFARVLKPKAVMLENVPGLRHDRRWRKFVTSLERLGFICEYRVLNAADYGVPQRRSRLVLIANRIGRPEFGELAKTRVTVGDAIKDLEYPDDSDDPLHKSTANRSHGVKTLIRSIPKDGGSRTDLPHRYQLFCHRLCNGFRDVYGRMAWGDVAPTITGGCINPSKGRFLHPTDDREITLREAAILQSFPKSYSFPLDRGRYATAQLIGNALPPEFVRRHAVQIAKDIH